LIAGALPRETLEVAVNKSQLISAVAKASGLEKRQSERAVDAFVATVIGEVKNGRKVSLVGFGAFNPTSRGAREGRNPQTGAPVRIGPSKGVRFAAGSTFKDAVNGRGPVPTVTPLPPPARVSATKAAKKSSTQKAGGRKATARRPVGRKTAKTARKAAASRKKTTAKRSTARVKKTAKRARRR
jgi:DNA-binding protein HU-beta